MSETQKKVRRKSIPYHTLGGKRNLTGIWDEYPCTRCGKVFKFARGRTEHVHGRCMVSPEVYAEWQAEQEAKAREKQSKPLGWWSNRPLGKEKCSKCETLAALVPRKGHKLSEYWRLERDDGSLLVYCPAGCTEA